MNHPHNRLIIIVTLLLFILAACEQEPVEVTRIVEVPGAEVTRIVEVTVAAPVEEAPVAEEEGGEGEGETAVATITLIPYQEAWLTSGHADIAAEAFIHWNEEDPAEVPENCARCHSTPGFMDFLGADGSAAGVVDAPAPIGSVIECQACHNDMTVNLDTVTFPSGLIVSDLDSEARCMQCHQGRASTVTVNDSIVNAGLDPATDLDTVSEDLGFSNIHYFAAAATRFGTWAKGGYEYDGLAYDAKFDHVAGYDTCVSCHDPHTLEVQVAECQTCHTDVETVEDFVDVRMPGSLVDYNGNGDMEEGIYNEIEGLRATLFQAMQTYATDVAGAPLVYDEQSHPYFFTDTNGDGLAGEGEERYATWTPRLAKAAYNFQVSLKDPGRYAHGGKYIIQLLYDSLADLNQALAEPIDMSAMRRIDHGHFAASEEPFRHWDAEGAIVPGTCSKCHSAAGLPLLATEGVSISQPASGGLNCATCHSNLETFELYQFEEVTFPSGAKVTLVENENDDEGLKSNTCINCHQGRSSSVTLDRAIGDAPPDQVSESLRFQNIHYFAAGATLFGSEVQGAYQYAGQEYVGRNEHVNAFDTCIECHNAHALEVQWQECSDCHENVTGLADLTLIRASETDYDGDGDVSEGIAGEIATMGDVLFAAMQAYASATEGVSPILYDSHAYPYFFADTNGDGVVSEGDEGFATWTPNLLRAAYNYQYLQKDPGAFAHNSIYVLQILFDSINGVGGDTSGMTRAVAPPPGDNGE